MKQYSHHFDWGSGARGWGRVSSFMVWVHAEDLEGGGTEFPRLERSAAPDWRLCRFIECGTTASKHQTLSPTTDTGDGDVKSRTTSEKDSKNKNKKTTMRNDNDKEMEVGKGKEKDGEGKPVKKGVTFKAIPGNAVFWENFRPDGTGRGWQETWHAGLPVTKGTKVGLNIWSSGRLT